MPNSFPFIKIKFNKFKISISGPLKEISVDQLKNLNENEFTNFIISWKFGAFTVAKIGRPHLIAYKIEEEEKFNINFFTVSSSEIENEKLTDWKIYRF